VFCLSLFVLEGKKTKDWAARTPQKTNNDRQNTTQKTND
jgi:hypothetical protein